MRAAQQVLIAGFGDIGERVAARLAAAPGRYRVTALVRTADRAAAARALGATPLLADLDSPATLARAGGLADIVLHFAPPPAAGPGDPRTRHLLAALARPAKRAGMLSQHHVGPRRLVYISTTGVYGDAGGEHLDETRPRAPASDRARRRFDAEDQLRAWGRRTGADVVILRAPGIYAATRLPRERLAAGLPALTAEDDVFSNHIHADDLAGAVLRAMRRGGAGRAFNAVDGSGLRMGDYFDLVADALGLPRPPRVPRAELAGRVTPAMMSFMQESRRIDNARLTRELGVRLRYPTVGDFLAAGMPA